MSDREFANVKLNLPTTVLYILDFNLTYELTFQEHCCLIVLYFLKEKFKESHSWSAAHQGSCLFVTYTIIQGIISSEM